MKFIFLLLFIFSSVTRIFGQNDTSIVYLDNNDKLCPEKTASRYAIEHKENGHWKRMVFDKFDDKIIYAAYYSDAAYNQFDGLYNSFNKNGKMIVTGRYINNKKTGLWKGYSDDGKLIDSLTYHDGMLNGTGISWNSDGSIRDSFHFETEGKGMGKGFWPDGKPKDLGHYVNGKKTGLWTYFYKNGIKCQEVKYEADSALTFTCFSTNGNIQTANCYYEREAQFKGGDKAWIKYLINKLSSAKYPNAYHQGEIYGTVYVQFIVDSDGKIVEPRALNSIDPELDKIALDMIKQSPKWEPAVQFNRNVKAYRKQPITFSKAE